MKKKFNEYQIQQAVNTIQSSTDTPEFMLVKVDGGFFLENDGIFRDDLNEEAFFTTENPNRSDKELLHELALALIEMSL